MTNAERTAKIEHYEFMLATMTLDPRHEWWINNQLYDLRQEVYCGDCLVNIKECAHA